MIYKSVHDNLVILPIGWQNQTNDHAFRMRKIEHVSPGKAAAYDHGITNN